MRYKFTAVILHIDCKLIVSYVDLLKFAYNYRCPVAVWNSLFTVNTIEYAPKYVISNIFFWEGAQQVTIEFSNVSPCMPVALVLCISPFSVSYCIKCYAKETAGVRVVVQPARRRRWFDAVRRAMASVTGASKQVGEDAQRARPDSSCPPGFVDVFCCSATQPSDERRPPLSSGCGTAACSSHANVGTRHHHAELSLNPARRDVTHVMVLADELWVQRRFCRRLSVPMWRRIWLGLSKYSVSQKQCTWLLIKIFHLTITVFYTTTCNLIITTAADFEFILQDMRPP